MWLKSIGRKMVPAASLWLAACVLLMGTSAFSQERVKAETIEATARGTGTQMGQMFGVKLIIYEYSTPEDRQTLVDAFKKAQNEGLVNALSKMRAVGRVSMTGTVGYDVSFIRMIPTPTGRKIRFVTNRRITIGETWTDSRSQAFNLSAGEFDINEKDNDKSTGALYPAAQLIIDKEGQLQFQLNQNPWQMVGIIVWKGTPGVN